MAQELPTPRELLTSLITALSSHAVNTASGSTNAIQNAPAEVRSLLTTLHIIFPHLLLPALDLLDRQLATKIIQLPTHTQKPTSSSMPPPSSSKDGKQESMNEFYMVQSSQSTNRRHQKSYVVRLGAWNCTCASFVFSAFPPSISSESSPLRQDIYHQITSLGLSEEKEESKWEFGGASQDGRDGGAVPACKHLLACVLADRWEPLRKMVQERWVGREEMAGLGAGF